MQHQATLIYNEKKLRRAARSYCSRRIGKMFLIAFLLNIVGLVDVLREGRSDWLVGVLVTTVVMGTVVMIALYFVIHRSWLRDFNKMGSSQALFTADESLLNLVANEIQVTLPWSSVSKLWKFTNMWMLFSKSQYLILPLEGMTPEFQAFIIERVHAVGGKIG